jgi:hypothetical protein
MSVRDLVRHWSRNWFGDGRLWEALTWCALLLLSFLVVFMAVVFAYAVTLALWNILFELARVQ